MNNKGKKITKNKRKEKSQKNGTKKQKNNLDLNTKISNNDFFLTIQKKLYLRIKAKYNCNKKIYDLFLVECLLNNANCRLVSIFKEKMINDYIEEFLHRKYMKSECEGRIPKFYKYYKNYLIFFCKPIFRDMHFNKLIQNNGEKKAELYYKRNYLKSKSIDNIKDCGFEKTDSDNSSESKNDSRKKDGIIFNESVKEKIENMTIMTTISNDTNKTVNLNMENEKLEVFCENKYDKSNDTTVVDFINRYQKEIENKNKHIKIYKKFNHSYIFGNRNKYANKIKTNATSYKLLIDKNRHNLSNNKLLKKKFIKNKSSEKNEVIEEKKNRKISIDKVKKYLKIYFSNSKDGKHKKKLIENKEEKPKTNISLKLIHKGYYKFENEINNMLINYRNNLKDKYIQLYKNFSNAPTNYKCRIKSRNDNNKLLYKESISTVNNVYATQNNKNKNINFNHSNNKSYNNNNSSKNMKINKKYIKSLNNNDKTNYNRKSHKKMINISIKTENSNKILNSKNNISNNRENTNAENNNKYNSSKNYHSKNIIKIKKNDNLFKSKKKCLKKDKPINITITKIKNNKNLDKINNDNNSKDKNISTNLKISKKKTYNQSRNYIGNSSLNNLYDGFSSKYYHYKNKSINYNSVNNLNNNQTYNSNKNLLNKKESHFNNKSNDKKKIIKNNSNLMHISLPSLNYDTSIYNKSKLNNKKYNNNSSKKYINSFNNILNKNKNGKLIESRKKNYNSISNIFNSDSKFKKSQNKNNHNSKYKYELYNNSSYKNNKYNKTIASYNTKNVSNNFK